jgi:ParB/RepB/Spo0J family partition protein
MTDKIHESLRQLAVDVKNLMPLEGNPRKGNVQSIVASYREFGQIKPIVIRPNNDGTATVIAGNHQLEAAKLLGWDKIAAVSYNVDNKKAIAFAIADNRTMELGYTEAELLSEFILEIHEEYPELVDSLGWDEFEIAELEQTSIREEYQVIGSDRYVPPIIFSDEEEAEQEEEPVKKNTSVDLNTVSITKDKDGNQQINVRPGVDQNDAVIRGSTTVSPRSAPQAVVQYTIVFDNTQQQADWYTFIKWLRSDAGLEGDTVAEKLISFISEHTP